MDNYLFCSCDENYDKIKKEQLTGPKIYRINNGHIDKEICMLDTALNLVACNHSNVFIAITEFEVLVIDTGTFLKFQSIILAEYETIYRSILKFIYWPIYVSLILTDIWNFSKNHISTDICRNFSFFNRYMKIFKKRFWAYIDRNFGQFTYIG